ncbi:MAG: hypothetical protein HYV78_01430 [Candidatus Wildermuthbacteria bacterium]|nr:hypothetical protein [Candidatus Wildermuthbacteria bacterium]
MLPILSRIRELPEEKRKIILWAVTILFAVGLLSWWIPRMFASFRSIRSEDFQKMFPVQDIKKDIEQLPAIELPTKNLLNDIQQSLPSKEELEVLEKEELK